MEAVLRSLSFRNLVADSESRERALAAGITAIGFALVFFEPMTTLARDWWQDPNAGHGLLLAPVAIWLAWRSGLDALARPQRWLGAMLLVGAVLVRYASGLAAELFTMRVSMIVAILGLVVYYFGVAQARRWWLPFTVAFLSVPLPELVTQALALPLQFKASQMGASLLEWRQVPVQLSGNVIRLPGQSLFVTEACSGLRSLTALISVAILMGALFLRTATSRVLVLLLAIPIAIVINGVRVFLTGFLVYYVSPRFGTGFMHVTEGWLLFVVSMTGLGVVTALAAMAERRFIRNNVNA